ncbi:hypothetical protein [Acidianus sp. RZ1]|uniref:hypothetical protein n=1 Tax=Acidianus sp. RZ1 TaxID=1540082 RepID=UPI0014924251|nr:hypothetical protein [Acidianus sp. RZ1]NON61860.1 hypothetical protein [Acidianus sp. RZ1]
MKTATLIGVLVVIVATLSVGVLGVKTSGIIISPQQVGKDEGGTWGITNQFNDSPQKIGIQANGLKWVSMESLTDQAGDQIIIYLYSFSNQQDALAYYEDFVPTMNFSVINGITTYYYQYGMVGAIYSLSGDKIIYISFVGSGNSNSLSPNEGNMLRLVSSLLN